MSNVLPFPAVNVGRNTLYFNKASTTYLADSRINIYIATDYIVFLPAKDPKAHIYCITEHHGGRNMTIPSLLRAMKLKPAKYRLYKYKDGACLKRHEPLSETEEL